MFCDAVAPRFIDVTGSFQDAEGERLVRAVQLRKMERPEPTNGLWTMLSLCYTPSFQAQKLQSMAHLGQQIWNRTTQLYNDMPSNPQM